MHMFFCIILVDYLCKCTCFSTGPTVLGYLTDGTEVAVKLLDSSVKQFTTSELERLTTMDVSNYFIIKYKVSTGKKSTQTTNEITVNNYDLVTQFSDLTIGSYM